MRPHRALPIVLAALAGWPTLRLANPGRSVLKLILLLTAAALCFTTGQHGWAVWYTGYTLLNVALAFAFKQDY